MGIFRINVLIASVLVVCGQALLAQTNTFTLKAGTDINKAIPFESRYIYNTFQDGKVYFKNGRTSSAKVNYSVVFSQIQFIGNARDTLILANIEYIDTIAIGKDVYYFQNGYGHVQRIARAGKMMLGKNFGLFSKGTEKAVSYGQYSQTSAVDGYSTYIDGDGRMRNLTTNDQTVLQRKSWYFWIDPNKRISVANKSNLLRIFPKHKKVLTRFIDQHRIDFLNEQDLTRLLEFTASMHTQ
jgi:hypothetical protein